MKSIRVPTKNEEPLVSIITPTFNRANFLRETIESVLSQDYTNIEHLIIDDGSTDHTKELMDRFSDHGNIRYFHQNNSGQNIARNRGLAEATGEFICFLDSDDKFLPGKVRRSIEAFEQHPEVDVVYGDYIFIDQYGDQLNQHNMQRYSGCITKRLLRDNCVSMNTTMVRANAIRRTGGFSKHVTVADDYDLWLRMSVRSQFYYLPEKLSAYRLMGNQISSDKVRRFSSNEEIILRFFSQNGSLISNTEKQDLLNFFYTRAARHFSNDRNWIEAARYFRKAFGMSWKAKRTYRALARAALTMIR